MQTSIGYSKFGMAPSQPYGTDVSAAANGAVTTGNSHVGSHHVDDPMMWLFGIGALTLGLVAFSTSVRVGRITASVSSE